MSFDLGQLREAVQRHGRVVRVVVADMSGSSPREPGAAMLVWKEGQSGTIGGGALEWEAARVARREDISFPHVERVALGPGLGQCCGGSVTLVFEEFTARNLPAAVEGYFLRRVEGSADVPLPLARMLRDHRNSGAPLHHAFSAGWLIEPIHEPKRAIWIWGAGHVGRALVSVLAPLPGLDITWVDTAESRFPPDIPAGVNPLVAADPAAAVAYAPKNGEHFVLTYSHALDLDICHRLLDHGFAFLGLIGSQSKRARFRKRLAALGHDERQIGRITCPIGDTRLGKHPQAIAVGVAHALLSQRVARQQGALAQE